MKRNSKPHIRRKSYGRVLHQSWVEKRAKRMFSANWQKQWFVLHDTGYLFRFQKRPESLRDMKEPTRIYEIGPESNISRDGYMVRFTWGEKRNGTFEERVFRPCQIETDEKIETPSKRTNPDTEMWFRMLTEIALRKRLQFVIKNRSVGDDEKSASGRKLWNRSKKKLSQIQGNRVKDKFHQDKMKLWSNAVRFYRTIDGDKLYFEFANYNLEILWKIYTDGETYLTKSKIKVFLFDAFVVAFKKSKEADSKVPLYLDERVYLAKVYLDKNMDGNVTYKEFERVNTKQFWLAIDFLTPIDENAATVKLWMQIFNSLENHGELSAEIIYRAFQKYDLDDEGFLYQPDMEQFLIDFMCATKKKWPSIKDEQIDQFCDTIVIRGAIALRYLDKDETGRITREEFNEIGHAEFWAHVDYLTAVDALEAHLSNFDDFSSKEEDFGSPRSMPVSEIIQNSYKNYVSYTTERDKLPIDKFIARPSFSIEKYASPAKALEPSSLDEVFEGTLQSQLIQVKERGQSTSTSCLNEDDIDSRLIDTALYAGYEEAGLSPGAPESPSNEKDDKPFFEIDIEMDSEEHDCRE